MIRKHPCLAGGEKLGDAPDCPKCRVAMLDSFRRPADAPETGLRTAPNLFHPHLLLLPEDRTRTVEINPVHTVAYGAQPYTDGRAGGIWRAVCACGWRQEGQYAGPRYRAQAEETAQQYADRHLEDPGDGGTPLPETVHITNAVVVPNTGRQGGTWRAACTCGWHETGGYARDTGEATAQRLADIKCKKHRENPEGQTT